MERPAAELGTHLTVQDAHRIVHDLLRPRMAIYWFDFIASYATAIALFVLAPAVGYGPWFILIVVVSGLALYRAAVFLHEIVHFSSRKAFARFRLWWNITCGIPLLIPVFMYDCHAEHHNWRHYGTARDAEYLPLARLSRWKIVGILATVPVLPVFGIYRFGLLTPLSWLVPWLRTYVYTRVSALKLDVEYEGVPPAGRRERIRWAVQEVGCAAVVVIVAAMALTGTIGWERLVQGYLMVLTVAALNTLRLLGAHRYLGDEDAMTQIQQVQDTINYPRRPLVAELWAPVGLRLHALHHLLPALPYHAYPKAHARLLTQLPAGSEYFDVASPGLWFSLKRLWAVSGDRQRLAGLDTAEAIRLMTQRG